MKLVKLLGKTLISILNVITEFTGRAVEQRDIGITWTN